MTNKWYFRASPVRLAFYLCVISIGLSFLQFWTPCRASGDVSGWASVMAVAALACGYTSYFRQPKALRQSVVKVALGVGWVSFVLSVFMVH